MDVLKFKFIYLFVISYFLERNKKKCHCHHFQGLSSTVKVTVRCAILILFSSGHYVVLFQIKPECVVIKDIFVWSKCHIAAANQIIATSRKEKTMWVWNFPLILKLKERLYVGSFTVLKKMVKNVWKWFFFNCRLKKNPNVQGLPVFMPQLF